jgi:hypothetical protein
MNVFQITEECWDFDLWILWPCDGKSTLEWINGKFPDAPKFDLDDFGAYGTHLYWGRTNVIHLREWDGSTYWYGVLVHELFHCADEQLRLKELRLSDDSKESWAYLIESLTRRALDAIKERKG